MAEAKAAKPFNVRRFLIFLLIGVVLVLLIAGVISITGVWNTILLEPMLNFLVLMSKYFLGSFGIAVIVLTILIRLVMFPLTMKQLQSSKAMQAIGPKMKELQKKYAKDQQKLNQEMMKLYKEEGINPLGCAFPMLVQFPIWIALYQSVIQALGLYSRKPSWPIQTTVFLFAYSGCTAPEPSFLMAGSHQRGYLYGDPDGGEHVGAAKDVRAAHRRPAAAVYEPYYAVGNATDVWPFLSVTSQRTFPLLGSLQYYQHDIAVSRNWLGYFDDALSTIISEERRSSTG